MGTQKRLAQLVGGLVVSLGIAPLPASAQSYPSKAIRLIVPFAASGPTDGLSRLLASSMEKQFGTPVVVENRPGAFSLIGTRAVASADPDGYTLLIGGSNIAVEQVVNDQWPYKAERDLTPIAGIARVGLVIFSNPKLPVKSLAELIDYARANPGKLNQAVAGAPAFDIEVVKSRLRLQVVPILYKGGAEAIQGVVAGETHWGNGVPQAVAELAKAGRLVALAYTDAERHPMLPNTPTIREAGVGLNDYSGFVWFAAFGPAALPQAVVSRLNGAIKVALSESAVADQLKAQGMAPLPTSAAELGALVRQGTKQAEELVAQGIKLR